MKRLLLISPHFPPDASAGAHRARVLAPYLEATGWLPAILTVAPDGYAGPLDSELAAMLPPDLDVIRVDVIGPHRARRVGFGDLGLRALPALWRAARALTAAQKFDAVFITTYPVYPALLGPRLRARTNAPLVIDLQDPWTGEWGLTVGGGRDGSADLRSRLSRRVMALIEERVLPACDAITGVSSGLLQELATRYPVLRRRPKLALPIGLDPRDLSWVDAHPGSITLFDPHDGGFHLCCVGTLLPLAMAPLRALFGAVRDLRERRPELVAALRLHFVGTSNQSAPGTVLRVLPVASACGIADLVTEHPPRIPFADALRIQKAASAVVILGSTEARYTASKLAPVLATGRPVLVIAHTDSDIARVMRLAPTSGHRSCRLASFADQDLPDLARRVTEVLEDWLTSRPAAHAAHEIVRDLEGPVLARRLAHLLDGLPAV